MDEPLSIHLTVGLSVLAAEQESAKLQARLSGGFLAINNSSLLMLLDRPWSSAIIQSDAKADKSSAPNETFKRVTQYPGARCL